MTSYQQFYACARMLCCQLGITPTFLGQEARTPGSSFLYSSDSRLPVRRAGVGTGRLKRSSRMCGQMWDSWWLCGLRASHFTAADGDHWWDLPRDFAERLPQKPLRTATFGAAGGGLQVTSWPSWPSWLQLPRNSSATFLAFIHSKLPSICVNGNSYIKHIIPGISESGFVFVPKPR